jgi:hypothetical protein
VKPIRPEDRNKTFALVGAVVLMFAFLFWRISSTLSQAPSQSAPQSVSLNPANPNSPGGSTLVASTEPARTSANAPGGDDIIEIPSLFAAATADPFREVLPKEAPPAPVRRPAVRRGTMHVADRDFRPVPLGGSLGVQPLPGSVKPETKPETEVHVQGVIAGSDPVAVVEVGGKSYVVRQGESFGEGMKATRISEQGLTIDDAGKSRTVPVGGK